MKLIDKEEFDKLDKYGKRVAIAKDILFRIGQGKIHPCAGAVFRISCSEYYIIENMGAQNFLNDKTCTCCAKGAIIASWIGNFNKYKKLDFDHISTDVPEEVLEIFGKRLICAIEAIFESDIMTWHPFNKNDEPDLCWDLKNYGLTATFKDLASDIFTNLIENNGVLKIKHHIID